jgi:hypothetical protein
MGAVFQNYQNFMLMILYISEMVNDENGKENTMCISYIKGTSEHIPRLLKKSCMYISFRNQRNMASHFISFKDS